MTPRLGKILLRRPRPYQDEILASYIIRLAEVNFYSCHGIFEIAGFKKSKRIYALNLLDQEDDLSSLSYATGTSDKTLRSMAFSRVEGDKKYFQLSPTFKVPQRSIQFKELRVCTQCLLEAQYIRKVWSFIPIAACPIHSCLLINKCPNCNSLLYWNIYFISPEKNMIATCRSCGFDLRESFISTSKTSISADEIMLSRFTHYIWSSLPIDNDYKLVRQNHPILNLEPEYMYLIIAFLMNYFLISGCFKFEIQLNLDNVDLYDVVGSGFLLFKELSLNNNYFLVRWSNCQYSPCSTKLKAIRGQIEVWRLKDSRSMRPKRTSGRGLSVWRSTQDSQVHFLC